MNVFEVEASLGRFRERIDVHFELIQEGHFLKNSEVKRFPVPRSETKHSKRLKGLEGLRNETPMRSRDLFNMRQKRYLIARIEKVVSTRRQAKLFKVVETRQKVDIRGRDAIRNIQSNELIHAREERVLDQVPGLRNIAEDKMLEIRKIHQRRHAKFGTFYRRRFESVVALCRIVRDFEDGVMTLHKIRRVRMMISVVEVRDGRKIEFKIHQRFQAK